MERAAFLEADCLRRPRKINLQFFASSSYSLTASNTPTIPIYWYLDGEIVGKTFTGKYEQWQFSELFVDVEFVQITLVKETYKNAYEYDFGMTIESAVYSYNSTENCHEVFAKSKIKE